MNDLKDLFIGISMKQEQNQKKQMKILQEFILMRLSRS